MRPPGCVAARSESESLGALALYSCSFDLILVSLGGSAVQL